MKLPASPPPTRRDALLARLDASGRYPTWVLLAALAGMFATSFPVTILAASRAPIAWQSGADGTTRPRAPSAPPSSSW